MILSVKEDGSHTVTAPHDQEESDDDEEASNEETPTASTEKLFVKFFSVGTLLIVVINAFKLNAGLYSPSEAKV